MSRRTWWWVGVTALFAVAVAIRLEPVLAHPNVKPVADAGFFHDEANFFVRGIFWANAQDYYSSPSHPLVQAARLPPLYSVVLALSSAVGAKGFFAHRVWSCVVGSAVVPVAALTGRTIVGPRAGLIAAALAAFSPALWISESLVHSETLSPVLALVVVLAAYRYAKLPSIRGVALLGAAIALAALTRDELALLVVFILVPVTLVARLPWRRRLAQLGCGVGVFALVVGPWVGYNLARFSDPVLISDGLGVTLAEGNCPVTYNGPDAGFSSYGCRLRAHLDPHADESVQAAEYQSAGVDYMERHLGSLPRVVALREGRAFAFYHPVAQTTLDDFLQGGPLSWYRAALWTFYPLCALGALGVVLLRRRGTPVFPLLALGAVVVVAVAVTWGESRFRVVFDAALVVLAAVALDAAAARVARWRRQPSHP